MAADNSITPTDASLEPRPNDPKGGAVYQQRMKAWYPILHPVWVIAALLVIGVVFVPVGVRLKQISDDVVELSIKYDSGKGSDSDVCAITKPNQGKVCSHTFTVDRDMESPIMVYYQIENFHQNHRKYFQSRDDQQLLGKVGGQTKSVAKDCDPLNKLGNITLNPCGLIANTLFNDIFNLTSGNSSDGKPLKMLENGIAWESDLRFKFKQPDDFKSKACDSCDDCNCSLPEWSCDTAYKEIDDDGKEVCHRYFYPEDSTTQYLHETYPMISPLKGVTDEHFVVWMRTAALPKFRKLYGFIDKDISKGTKLTFEIESNWIVDTFKGSKTLVLSTTSQFGGKNPALGNYFIGVGIFCLVCALLFGLKHYFNPRKLADRKYLKYKGE